MGKLTNPPRNFMTLGDVCQWLKENGVREPKAQVRALIRKGVIKIYRFGSDRNYFNGQQIMASVPLNGEKEK
jgi:hypothetical protein